MLLNCSSWLRALPAMVLALGLCGVRAAAQTAAGSAGNTPQDAPQAQVGTLPARLSDVEGSVRIVAAAAAEEPASATPGNIPPPPPDSVESQGTVNMPVLPGARLEAGSDGRAEVQFSDGSIARITPNSSAVLTTLDSAGEQMRSLGGLAYYEVPGRSSGQLVVRVGGFTLTPSLNSLVRVDMDARPYQIAALRGTVLVESASPDVSFTLDEGQAAAVDAADPNGYEPLPQVASISWDQWNSDRDDALDQLAQGQTSARDGSGSSDADAWNDLDYYGTWYDVPGSGEAWAPDGVNQDFDPYGNGDWSYYNGVGYTWISAYPWGWLPYHCGNWNYFSGFGWGWQPVGGCGAYGGAGWYPYAGISHAPYGYRLPLFGGPGHRPLRTHLGGVPIGPLQPVHRAPQYEFRVVGGSRPEPRALALAGNNSADGNAGEGSPSYARTLTLTPMPTQQYRGEAAAFGVPGAGRAAYAPQRAPYGSVISPSPRVYSSSPRAYSPAPRVYSPPPRVEAPPAHVAAPPAPAGHGH